VDGLNRISIRIFKKDEEVRENLKPKMGFLYWKKSLALITTVIVFLFTLGLANATDPFVCRPLRVQV